MGHARLLLLPVLNKMFNFTPPIRQNVVNLFLLFTCTLLISACTCGRFRDNQSSTCGVSWADTTIYYNHDSLLHYARLAYLEDDPRGLFITGSAAYLRADDPHFPSYLTTVPLDEADIMILHAAELGSLSARMFISDLARQGRWSHYIPE